MNLYFLSNYDNSIQYNLINYSDNIISVLKNDSIITITNLFNLIQILPFILISLILFYRLIHYLIAKVNYNELLGTNSTTRPAKLTKFLEIFKVFISNDDIIKSGLIDARGVGVTGEASSQSVIVERTKLPRKKTLLFGIGFEMIYWILLSLIQYITSISSQRAVLSEELSLLDLLYLHSTFLLAFTWTIAFLNELITPTHYPISTILILSILQTTTSIVSISDSIHTLISSSTRSSTTTINFWDLLVGFERLPDLICTSYLIWYLINLPLQPYSISILPSSSPSTNERPSSPEDTNTILGTLTYSWMESIMTLARLRPLISLDVWSLSLNNKSEILSKKFKELKEKTLLGKILRASARDILIDFCMKLIAVTLSYSRPYFIQKILENLSLPSSSLSSSSSSTAYSPLAIAQIYALLAFLVMIGRSISELIHFHHARRIGMRLRIELTVAVFEKGLVRRDFSGMVESENEEKEGGEGKKEEGASVGKVVSLISDDTNRVLRMGCDSHLIYGAPLELILALFLLYSLMGWSAFVGFSILVIAVPINYSLGKRSITISKERSAARDARQASLQELISAIRTIKFFGWSSKFILKTEAKRSIELQWMIQDWINRFYLTTLWTFVSIIVPLFSFYSFVKLQEKELTVPIAFTALSLFSMVRGPLNQIPDFGIRLLQTQVSIGRIESFLKEEEVANYAKDEIRSEFNLTKSTTKLGFKENASFKWSGSDNWKLDLGDIEFPEGKLSIIQGPTGSGKSSLLLALLGEMEVISGDVDLPTTVSYCAQHPWLESASIRNNIIFGSPFDAIRYEETLNSCALLPDLALFPEGDLTSIGERGVALSGGQRARIALARALYAPTKYLLLDDVLSAVDAHTSRFLFNRALTGDLMKGRTCILVTHHVDLVLSGASCQVELRGGSVVSKGAVVSIPKITISPDDSISPRAEEEVEAEVEVLLESKRIDTESWSTGSVKRSIFTTYLHASSYILWLIILLLIIVRPAFAFGEQYWLRLWGEASDLHVPVDTNYYLRGYAMIGAGSAVVVLLSTVVVYFGSLRASRSIFTELLARVVSAPPRFFDTTPGGRITNRFTNDISIVDEALASNFNAFAANIAGTVASLVVTTLILPMSFVPIIFFATLYSIIFVRYLSVNRDLNRIAATTASPIFSGFQELLIGISTIRAFGREKSYRAILCENIDETLALWYCSCTLDVWLSIRTQFLSACCLLATASFAIHAGVSPGLAGIAIASAMGVIQNLDSLCTSYGRIVVSLNSMERITEYLELPQEPLGGIIPASIWPSSSVKQESLIQVKDLVIRYAPELPEVLSGVSFDVKPRERIAIAGRTGSGKSTLAMSLLRFVDPSSGSIIIDGISITDINLEVLRQRITFLPQDATLFTGTIRSNLDPFDIKSDEECLDALRRVHLLSSEEIEVGGGGKVSRFTISLGTLVAAGGQNFSAGERQLVALARALLRDSKIILFDESTASIDFGLDTKIQETIRNEFNDACLITIAHRLRTIIDYDRVLVLEAGKVVEFDSPSNLLKYDSAFHRMCKESGDYQELLLKVSQLS